MKKILAYLLLVPIIAIFTKYDRLVKHICLRNSRKFARLDKKLVQEKIENEVKADLDKLCFSPFRRRIVGMTQNISEIVVSSECDYS